MIKIFIVICLLLMSGCSFEKDIFKYDYINEDGYNILTRVNVPKNYTRVDVEEGTFADYVRNYELKDHGSPLLKYDGSDRVNQNAHVAVFALPIENEDLQQCADSVMRFYAEYYYQRKEYNKINFHFVDGFKASFSKWVQGYRIKVSGNTSRWVKSASYDDSYKSFKKFMRMVFAYSSTLSMAKESKEIDVKDIEIGDIFIRGGSPGHVVMVVDVCENEKGKKAFLLAQGLMPAQGFHIIKNPRHEDPWYYEDEVTYPFKTQSYTFKEGSLKRLEY